MSTQLASFLSRHRGTFMEWGVNDCCLVMSDWVRLRTGFDPAEGIRGTYRGWKQAARVWRGRGGIRAAVSAVLDPRFARVSVSDARPGDVALIRSHRRSCTAVIVDTVGVWGPSRTGYRVLRGFPLIAIWRIP